jgi:hypothetical protein
MQFSSSFVSGFKAKMSDGKILRNAGYKTCACFYLEWASMLPLWLRSDFELVIRCVLYPLAELLLLLLLPLLLLPPAIFRVLASWFFVTNFLFWWQSFHPAVSSSFLAGLVAASLHLSCGFPAGRLPFIVPYKIFPQCSWSVLPEDVPVHSSFLSLICVIHIYVLI